MAGDLAEHSTDTLLAMKSQLMTWLIALAIIDGLVVVGFVVLLVLKPGLNVVPLIPVLLLPGLVLAPFLLRLTAVRKELTRRESQ